MATSSIGKTVVLTKETGRRMAEACRKPPVKTPYTGKPLKRLPKDVDLTKFK